MWVGQDAICVVRDFIEERCFDIPNVAVFVARLLFDVLNYARFDRFHEGSVYLSFMLLSVFETPLIGGCNAI